MSPQRASNGSSSLNENPTSERWLAYYEEARRRRRAHGPRGRTSRAFRQWRRRERRLLLAGSAAIGVLIAIFYAVLVR
jgi:hypothetical protein